MTSHTRADLISRDTVLKLLSDEETARVSISETKPSLIAGAEYLDLEQLEKGIQRASAANAVAMNGIITRAAVHEDTWKKIQSHLAR